MLANLRKSKLAANSILLVFTFSLLGATPLPAEERYPAVARLSFVSGEVTYSRGDDPDEWDDALENLPLTVGDRIYAPENGRAEIQLSSGNFVRLAPRSFLSTMNLSDDIKQFYIGEGAASFNIRRLSSDEVFEIDTPNVSVTFEEPGQYRVAVDENGDSRITVRRGRASIAANGKQIAVENSEIRVYGSDSASYEIVGLPADDAFDRWVAERDNRFDRGYADASRYASEDIIGAEDLAQYGRWEQIPEYGYAWTPAVVAAGWAPFSNGRWYWQDPWGWNWISNERWGWATSHYGRWTPYRSRWYWVPVRPRTRVRYAPACVEFVRVRDHVGWFPLHPRDRQAPWWERRDRRFDRNLTYVNRNYVTIVNQNTFITARPLNRHIVRDQVILREARAARFTEALPVPNRSSLRIVSDEGRRRGHRPGDHILNRVAVVRTAPPAPPRAFQEKLPEIQKNQGKAIEPARILAATPDGRERRLRVRPAADTGRGDFAPRNPSVQGGPALQPVTEARGKKLAAPDSAENSQQKTPAPRQAPQTEPSKATAGRERERQQGAQPSDRELDQQRQAQKEEERKALLQKQQQDRERQAQRKQRELERRQTQQKEDALKAQAQKHPVQQPQVRSREQQRLEELELQQREQEGKAQAQQNRQEQERRELKLQQERQVQQQKQDLDRRQQQERKAQTLQQQEQARREQQLRQQQLQERQAREQQRQQQEIERRQLQQREHERNLQSQQRQEQAREQQLRQQQLQAQREAQQIQRQQEQQERRPQPRRPQPQEIPVPQPMPQLPR
jgi:hypothetical protein